jgi:hypothetical protein
MRQTELFPYLIDQEALDNYKWYQDTLEQFKVNKKVCLDTKASFKKHHKFFNSLLGDDKHCQFLVKKNIKEIEDSMKRNKNTLIKIESNILFINKLLRKVNLYQK